MQVSNFVIFGVIEAFIVLVAICIFLLIHTHSLKSLIRKLQSKLEDLVKDLRQTRSAHNTLKAELDPANAYLKQVNEQLKLTRDYHESLQAGQDIALDLVPEAPPERQALAFRHALLIAEKEALHASKAATPDWSVITQRMLQLMQFYQSDVPMETTADLETLRTELDNSKKRIENLEKFKTLFFEMEKQWQQAQQQAQAYYEQLAAMADGVSDRESYENILERYNQVYNHIGNMITGGGDTLILPGKDRVSTIEITRPDAETLKELKQLRSVAADQHRIISELQRRLEKNPSAQEKDNLIAEMSAQLERQKRFVHESEMCMQQLEDELSRSMTRITELEEQVKSAEEHLRHIPKMKDVIQQFTSESKEMLQGITTLEQENEQLLAQMHQGSQALANEDEQVTAVQRELLTLQAQYADLEERYLELRMQTN